MKRVLLISSYNSHFVLKDVELLQKIFQVQKLILAGRTSFLQKVSNFFEIFFAVIKNDIVICWFADKNAFFAILFNKILNKKTIILAGGYETSDIAGYGGLQSKTATLIKYVFKNADKVITVSEFLAREIKELGFCHNPITIPLSIQAVKNKSPRRKLIVTCGSATKQLYKIKGIDVFASVVKDFKDYEKIIIGDYDENIKKKLLKINPKLNFMGKIDHKRFLDLLSETEIYCQFSQRESFGMAVLEALNSNCKVVVSAAGALPEITQNKAFIANTTNIIDCQNAVLDAVNATAPDNFDWIKKQYSQQNRIDALSKVIEEML